MLKYLVLWFAAIIKISASDIDASNTTELISAIQLCGIEGDGYCFHGQCIYINNIDENMHCICKHGYIGIRCQHKVLIDYQRSEKDDGGNNTYVPSPSIVLALVGIVITCCMLAVYRFTRRTKLPLQEIVLP
ncbi:secreted egf-like protein [Skunkpox virus]|uniref:Secreted egf-like protein n=1 Tax=Skunkpox virus TaxID=160796 RepID=A0A1C9KBG7_9POXV|nr:secreted egf-like protein [Skunkpox virus]AOP31492.1 secreted egf-like protein [Skunkpox virus]